MEEFSRKLDTFAKVAFIILIVVMYAITRGG